MVNHDRNFGLPHQFEDAVGVTKQPQRQSIWGIFMLHHGSALRTQARISNLCTVFTASLHPLWEEGIPLHHPHQRPCLLDPQHHEQARQLTDCHLGVVCAVKRTTPLNSYMEESLRGLKTTPFETVMLELPIDEATRSIRMRMLDELANLLLELMEQGREMTIVAVSHRREIHGSLILRHHLVALFDHEETLYWRHPAASEYGLIRHGCPASQRVRNLGTASEHHKLSDIPRCLDSATGLPARYLFARENLREQTAQETSDFASVIQSLARQQLDLELVGDLDQSLREATQDYIHGFETYFGMGGLQPTPTILFP